MIEAEPPHLYPISLAGRGIGSFTREELGQLGDQIAFALLKSEPKFAQILIAVGKHFNVCVADLTAGKKPDWVVWPRYVALGLIHDYFPEMTQLVLARVFNHERSWVGYALIAYKAACSNDQSAMKDVRAIRAVLHPETREPADQLKP